MQKMLKYLPFFTLGVSLGLISTGVFMMNVPIGLIVTGCLLIILDFLAAPMVKEGVGK